MTPPPREPVMKPEFSINRINMLLSFLPPRLINVFSYYIVLSLRPYSVSGLMLYIHIYCIRSYVVHPNILYPVLCWTSIHTVSGLTLYIHIFCIRSYVVHPYILYPVLCYTSIYSVSGITLYILFCTPSEVKSLYKD